MKTVAVAMAGALCAFAAVRVNAGFKYDPKAKTGPGQYARQGGDSQGSGTMEQVPVTGVDSRYVTCDYMRELDSVIGKPAQTLLGDNGKHHQLQVYDKKTGRPIGGYGKTTSLVLPSFAKTGIIGATEGRLYGQGTMLMENPAEDPRYDPVPKWCVESEGVSVPSPGYYQVLASDCKGYASEVKADLLENHNGEEQTQVPEFAIRRSRSNKDPDGEFQKEAIVDAIKGCRDGATIGIVKGAVAGGMTGGVPGAAAGAASGAAIGCARGATVGISKSVVKRMATEYKKNHIVPSTQSRRKTDEELITEALGEDGAGADLAVALLGDDDAKVKEAQRKFDASLKNR